MQKADAAQIGGAHYKSTYQHWNFLPDIGFGPEYYIGCATKYVTRHASKNGAEDIHKAIHFVEKLIELCDGGRVVPWRVPLTMLQHVSTAVSDYVSRNNLTVGGLEHDFLYLMFCARTSRDYSKAVEAGRSILAAKYPPSAAKDPVIVVTTEGTGVTLGELPATGKQFLGAKVHAAMNPEYGPEGYWGDGTVLWKHHPCHTYFKAKEGVEPWTAHQDCPCAPAPDAGASPTSAYVDQAKDA